MQPGKNYFMEFNFDAEKKPVVIMSVDDFMYITHGAQYASTDTDYVKRFPVTALQIIEASNSIDKMKALISNKGKFPDAPSLVE